MFFQNDRSIYYKHKHRIIIAYMLVNGVYYFCDFISRWWPSGSHDYLEGLPEADALGDCHPGGGRLRTGGWLQGSVCVCMWLHVLAYFGTRGLKAGVFSGVRLVGVDRQTAGAHERSPSLGRHPAGLPAGLGGHRVCVQPGDSYRLPAHPISTGAAHTHTGRYCSHCC